MSQQKLVLFDMDGTLLDTRLDIARAANCARGELGLPALSVDDVVRAVGDGVNLFVSRVTVPFSNPRFEEAKRIFLKFYEVNSIGDTKPYPGVEEVLQKFKERRHQMAIVSNKPSHLVDLLVRHFKWEKYFTVWLGGDSAARAKPFPDSIQMAMNRSGVSSFNDTFMVGDGTQDIEAAHAAKCAAVWCSWGFNQDQPMPEFSKRIDRAEQLLEFI